jgi:hypothetical protein
MVKKAPKSNTQKPAVTSDFQPTKMALMVSTLAAVSLVIVALIAVYWH